MRTSWPFPSGPGNRFQTQKLRDDLCLRLMETALWGSRKADLANPKACLRSESFRPYLFNDNRYQTIDDVVHKRHFALVETGDIQDFATEEMSDVRKLMPPSLGGGRLLVWERDLTIDDGLGESVTNGYLDVSDMPPWDTWVTYVSADDDAGAQVGYLVSWVPPVFLASVGEAVLGNAYDALFWLDDTTLLVANILKEEGWLN